VQRLPVLPATRLSASHPLLGVDLAKKELRRRATSVAAVQQMGGGDNQRARADEVAGVAEDLCSVGRVVGDAARVLKVL
jgi:hypothetical protein